MARSSRKRRWNNEKHLEMDSLRRGGLPAGVLHRPSTMGRRIVDADPVHIWTRHDAWRDDGLGWIRLDRNTFPFRGPGPRDRRAGGSDLLSREAARRSSASASFSNPTVRKLRQAARSGLGGLPVLREETTIIPAQGLPGGHLADGPPSIRKVSAFVAGECNLRFPI